MFCSQLAASPGCCVFVCVCVTLRRDFIRTRKSHPFVDRMINRMAMRRVHLRKSNNVARERPRSLRMDVVCFDCVRDIEDRHRRTWEMESTGRSLGLSQGNVA